MRREFKIKINRILLLTAARWLDGVGVSYPFAKRGFTVLLLLAENMYAATCGWLNIVCLQGGLIGGLSRSISDTVGSDRSTTDTSSIIAIMTDID